MADCQCGQRLVGTNERERGTCAKCYVASWSPEKRAAMKNLAAVGLRRAFKIGPQPTDADIDAAVDRALVTVGDDDA